MAKAVVFSKKHLEMIEKAVRYMISNLVYERHQALAHGCVGGSYEKEIEEYTQLKKEIEDARTAEN